MKSTVRPRLRAACVLVLLILGFLDAPAGATAADAAGDWTQFRNSPALLGVNPSSSDNSRRTVSNAVSASACRPDR